MSKSKIEWTDAVWNPVTGCTKVSEGCRNCYAERMSKRLAGRCGYPIDDPFRVTVHEDKYIEPLTWRKPRRVFVNSMSDLFHPDVKDDWILATFVAMALTYEHTGEMKEVSPGHHTGIYKPKHTFMILTKRPQRMKDIINRLTSKEPDKEWDKKANYFATILAARVGAPLPGNAIFNVYKWIDDGMPGLWLGVSVENQASAYERIPLLLQTPAAVKFVSCEPLLSSVSLRWISAWDGKGLNPKSNTTDHLDGLRCLDWVICGGESGPGARPVHPDWVRSLRDQCQEANVPFFFKQWGEHMQVGVCMNEEDDDKFYDRSRSYTNIKRINLMGGAGYHGPESVYMQRVGKKKSGRELDGRTWDEMPVVN